MASLNASIQAFSNLPTLPQTSEADQESFVIVEQSLESTSLEPIEILPVREQVSPSVSMSILSAISTQPQQEQTKLEAKVIPVTEQNGTMSVQSTASCEFPSADIQDKVHELVEENTTLKKTLSENNRSLKTQRDLILNWQDEVKQVLDDNKKQFKDAKIYIEELKKEKANLIEQLENMKKIQMTQKDTTDKDVIMRQLSVKDAELNQQRYELDQLNAELKLQKSAQMLSKANDEGTKEALKQIASLENEKVLSKTKNQALQSQINKLQTDFECSIETIKSLSKKLEEAEDDKKKLQAQNKSLNMELNGKVSSMQLLQLQVNATKTKLQEFQANASVGVGYDVIETAEKEIESLKKKLDSSNKYIEQVKVENGNLAQQELSSKEQLGHVQSELISVQLKNTELKQELMKLKESFEQQNDNIEKMIEDREQVYKIQLDVYKADFESERAARETLKTERDQLAEDLANIQRRNRELQEEIELVRENTDYVVAPQHQRTPPPTEYRCPICSVKFRSFRLLEDHVDTCTQFTI